MRALTREEIVDQRSGDAKFGNCVLGNSEEKRNESQKHQLLLDFLQGLIERFLVLIIQNLTEIVEKTLHYERDGDHDRADDGDEILDRSKARPKPWSVLRVFQLGLPIIPIILI